MDRKLWHTTRIEAETRRNWYAAEFPAWTWAVEPDTGRGAYGYWLMRSRERTAA